MSATPRSVAQTIDARKSAGHGTLIAYLPAGFPTMAESIEAAVAVLDAGADVLEFGVPYSDPVMDGVVIAQATQTALEAGFKLKHLFPAVKEIVERTGKPVLVMTYWNPVLQFGVAEFAGALVDAGGAGLITPDLIPDEANEWIIASDSFECERIFLAAPSSTDSRLASASQISRGFVYAVSTMGITGARNDVDKAAKKLVERVYEQGANRVCVGLGISTPAQVADVISYADGAIVGSALVKALALGGVQALTKLTQELSTGTARA
jgi:tryptophan synthase alpha chain